MPRPRKGRMVSAHPRVSLFTPQGVPPWEVQEVTVPVEGLEALRLADYEGLDQEEAAACMGVSRPTFSRVLTAARAVVAQALVKGWAIRVEGGDYVVGPPPMFGPGPGRGPGRGGGGGRRRGQGGKGGMGGR